MNISSRSLSLTKLRCRCRYYLIGDLPHLQKLKIVFRVDDGDAADDADAGDVNDDDRRHLQ